MSASAFPIFGGSVPVIDFDRSLRPAKQDKNPRQIEGASTARVATISRSGDARVLHQQELLECGRSPQVFSRHCPNRELHGALRKVHNL